jgi:GNAT superfamily N-acetyltransferase
MQDYHIRSLKQTDREWVSNLMIERWGSEKVVSRGVLHETGELPGFIAIVDNKPAGLITYNIMEDNCEIITLDSLIENIGIATALIDEVKRIADENGCARLWLITTNDNIHAIRFYQKRGFTITAIHCNAIEHSRRLKPQIPLIGSEGIPIRDEIEFEIRLP